MKSPLLTHAPVPAVLAALLAILLWVPACTNPRDKEKTIDSGTSLYILSQYVNNHNGTVTAPDGLVWMRCAYGQVWDAALDACTGTGSGTTYGAKSVAYCSTAGYCSNLTTLLADSGPAWSACDVLDFAGSTAWRMPTVYELANVGKGMDRATFLLIFPNSPDDKYFWSSNQDASDAQLARAMSFGGPDFGTDYGRTKTEPNYLKCVH